MRLYSPPTPAPTSNPKDCTSKIIRVATAAGSAIQKFSRNLSFMAQPCPLQAAIVVSEMNDKLSPNIAPPTTAPIQSGAAKPVLFAKATAIGVISVIVPTLVPIATETNALTTKRTRTENLAGIIESIKYATLSALLLPTTPTKMPAAMKIKIMVMIFLSPTPFPISSNFWSKLSFRFCKHATSSATRNATTIGIL